MNPQEIDVLSQLRHLAALRTVGELTPDEYDAKKAELRTRLLLS